MPDDVGETKYAPASQTAMLLRSGVRYCRDRLKATDMLTVATAASQLGVDRKTIIAWIRDGHCIGIRGTRRGFKLPQWQFAPELWPALAPVAKALGTTDGWALLSFFESPCGALEGRTPRAALEQGSPLAQVVAAAAAVAH